jgi:hypothetical protein
MAIQALTQLAETILDVVDWGIAVVVVLIFYEVISAFRGDTGPGTLTDPERSPVLTKLGWNKKGKKRMMAKIMNEYITEEKEEEELRKAVDIGEQLKIMVVDIKNAKKIENHKLLVNLGKKVEEFKKALDDSKRNFRNLRKATFRDQSNLKKVIETMEKAEVDTTPVTVAEKEILKDHQDTANLLGTVITEFKNNFWNNTNWKNIEKLKLQQGFDNDANNVAYDLVARFPDPNTGGQPYGDAEQDNIEALVNEIEKDIYNLTAALDKQTEAKSRVDTIIAATRDW